MAKKENSLKNKKTTNDEKSKSNNHNSSFSVFQVIIFAFLFVLMIWIIGFLSLEIDSQKQEIKKIHSEIDLRKKDSEEIFKYYVDKIRDFQKIDIKDQVQSFGKDIKDGLQEVRELMFDKEDLAKVNAKISALEEYNNTYRGTNLVFLTSVGLLRDVINRGQSFEVELNTLEIVGGRQKLIINAIETLKPLSKTGVKTFSQLKTQFDEMAGDVVFISNNPISENPTYKQRFWHRIKSLFKIRKIDLTDTSESADLIVARTENYLKDNKLDEAVKEIEKLKEIAPAGFEYIKSWYLDAKNKIDVDNIMSEVSSFAIERALNDIYQGHPKLKKQEKAIKTLTKSAETITSSKDVEIKE